MARAFVLGNGVSRSKIQLERLRNHGMIYGCNALYREFQPDVLVATDRPISQAIQQSGYADKNRFYTRKLIENSCAQVIPQPYYGFSSGPVATALAALDNHKEIYLLGFDLGPDLDNTFNNLYAGTEFYKPKKSSQTYTGNWVKQVVQISKNFSKCQFIRVKGPTTAEVKEFLSLPNFSHNNIEDFLKLYQ
jgi:hypothetical protein